MQIDLNNEQLKLINDVLTTRFRECVNARNKIQDDMELDKEVRATSFRIISSQINILEDIIDNVLTNNNSKYKVRNMHGINYSNINSPDESLKSKTKLP